MLTRFMHGIKAGKNRIIYDFSNFLTKGWGKWLSTVVKGAVYFHPLYKIWKSDTNFILLSFKLIKFNHGELFIILQKRL